MDEVEVLNSQLADIENIERNILFFKKAIKDYEEKKEEMIVNIKKAMLENGVLKWETDNMSITYVAPVKKITLDSKWLKEEMPEIYNQYSKETTTSDSLRIKIKGEK